MSPDGDPASQRQPSSPEWPCYFISVQSAEQSQRGKNSDQPDCFQHRPDHDLPLAAVLLGGKPAELCLDLPVPFPDNALAVALHGTPIASRSDSPGPC